jgi:hypothetical protein
VLQALSGVDHPGRELEHYDPELAGFAEGLQRGPEALPDLIPDLGGEVPVIEVLLADGAEPGPQILGECLGRGLVAGQQPERLHVKHEAGGRALAPELRVPGSGQSVVRAVHLDNGELARVVAEPLLRGVDRGRIELAGFGQGPVGPGGGPDEDVSLQYRDIVKSGV